MKISFSNYLKERDSFSASASTVFSFEVVTRKGFFDGEDDREAISFISLGCPYPGIPRTNLPTSAYPSIYGSSRNSEPLFSGHTCGLFGPPNYVCNLNLYSFSRSLSISGL